MTNVSIDAVHLAVHDTAVRLANQQGITLDEALQRLVRVAQRQLHVPDLFPTITMYLQGTTPHLVRDGTAPGLALVGDGVGVVVQPYGEPTPEDLAAANLVVDVAIAWRDRIRQYVQAAR